MLTLARLSLRACTGADACTHALFSGPSGAGPSTAGGGASARPAGAHAPPARSAGFVTSLPLVLPERLAKAKVLVELEGDGDAVDLEGDVGAVGRFYLRDSAAGGAGGGPSSAAAVDPDELRLDLKGVIYEARMLPSTTCMVVKIESGEAKARLKERTNRVTRMTHAHPSRRWRLS